MADTEYDGSFEVELPSKTSPLNCHAKLLGGPIQLYATRKNVITKIIKSSSDDHEETNSYTISTPLSYSTSCRTADHAKCRAVNKFGSSKTVDLPLPREWGLAPSSYYVPFVPIIGIPWLSISTLLEAIYIYYVGRKAIYTTTYSASYIFLLLLFVVLFPFNLRSWFVIM